MRQGTFDLRRVVLAGLGLWLAGAYGFFGLIALSGDAVSRAAFGMVTGLIFLWIIVGGSLMYLFRDSVRAAVLKLRINWGLKFVAFATLLALIEEAVTTGMTNLAPAFGVPMGAAYITASADYLDVVCFHSVVVLVPMIAGWAWLLSRHDFKPFAVFMLFGFTGMLCETLAFGPQNLILYGMWAFVYGLMVYLPAYTLPVRAARAPKLRHYVLAVVLPLLFAIPAAILVMMIHPVAIHF